MTSSYDVAAARKHAFGLLREADLLARSGRLDEANARVDEAESIFRALPGPIAYEVPLCLRRAQVLCGEQRWEQALQNYDRAFALREEHPDWPAIPLATHGIRARLLDLLGDHELARLAAEEAIDAITLDVNEDNRSVLAEMSALLGKVAASRGDNRLAASHFQSALRHGAGGKANPEVIWRSLYGLGQASEKAGERNAALDAYDSFTDQFRGSLDPEVQAALLSARTRTTFLRFGAASVHDRTPGD